MLAPFFPFPAARIAAQVAAGETGNEEPRVAQRPMAADLPMFKVLDVLLVEENLQIAVETPAKIGFQFRMQSGNQRNHRFAGGIVTLMGIGDEQVVGHAIVKVVFKPYQNCGLADAISCFAFCHS